MENAGLSKLERVCSVLEETALKGDAILSELMRPWADELPVPEWVHNAITELSAYYSSTDFVLRYSFKSEQISGADSPFSAAMADFHECSEAVWTLMSELSTAFKSYCDHADTSGLTAWRRTFCERYPDMLTVTKGLCELCKNMLAVQ